MSLSDNNWLTLLQHAISKYDSELVLKEKLQCVLSKKDIEWGIDTLMTVAGWKSRKDQLHKQQQSVSEVNDKAEKRNLLSFSKQKGKK